MRLSKRAQSIIEYCIVIVLIIGGIVVMGPYVIRSINAHFKSWSDAVDDSATDPLTPIDTNHQIFSCQCDASFKCINNDCSQSCGFGRGNIQCKPTQRFEERVCSPQGCSCIEITDPNTGEKTGCARCIDDNTCCVHQFVGGCGQLGCASTQRRIARYCGSEDPIAAAKNAKCETDASCNTGCKAPQPANSTLCSFPPIPIGNQYDYKIVESCTNNFCEVTCTPPYAKRPDEFGGGCWPPKCYGDQPESGKTEWCPGDDSPTKFEKSTIVDDCSDISKKCKLKCLLGPGKCEATCQGTQPANTTLCSGDGDVSESYTLVNECTSNKKCEVTCNKDLFPQPDGTCGPHPSLQGCRVLPYENDYWKYSGIPYCNSNEHEVVDWCSGDCTNPDARQKVCCPKVTNNMKCVVYTQRYDKPSNTCSYYPPEFLSICYWPPPGSISACGGQTPHRVLDYCEGNCSGGDDAWNRICCNADNQCFAFTSKDGSPINANCASYGMYEVARFTEGNGDHDDGNVLICCKP